MCNDCKDPLSVNAQIALETKISEGRQLCECPRCGRNHWHLGTPPKPKATIEELEAILNSESTDPIEILPDGTVRRSAPISAPNVPAQCAWRLIETAPRDRSRILLWQSGRGAFEGWWHDGWPSLESYWMDDADSEPEPTHWQPMLPTPAIPSTYHCRYPNCDLVNCGDCDQRPALTPAKCGDAT